MVTKHTAENKHGTQTIKDHNKPINKVALRRVVSCMPRQRSRVKDISMICRIYIPNMNAIALMVYEYNGRMEELGFYIPINSISVISGQWKGEHERLCAMKHHLGSERISPPAGFKPATPWSQVMSANRAATQTLP